MNTNNKIKEFYDQIQFPGPYTKQSLSYYDYKIRNPYISVINDHIKENTEILDIGCGTGLIANLMALKHPTCQITGIDFADSIYFADWFANDANIKNVKFEKCDIFQFEPKKFDTIICQGVLHHIPDWYNCSKKIQSMLAPNGTLLLGVYHPMGKVIKKLFNIDYKSDILHEDQEINPFEMTFTPSEIQQLFPGFKLCYGYPSWAVSVRSLFNFRNGGLVLYVLTRKNK